MARVVATWVCRRIRQSGLLMRSLPPNLTAPAWVCGSAVRSLKRITGACGPRLTLRAAHDSVSRCLPTEGRSIKLCREIALDRLTPSLQQLEQCLGDDLRSAS